MSTEEQRRKWRERKRRQRSREPEPGTPSFYREDKERLADMHTRLDLRKIASITYYLEERLNVFSESRSDLLRDAIDLLYTSLMDSDHFKEFTLHRDAYRFLKQRGLAPKPSTREGKKFEKVVIASEAYDMERYGITDDQEERKEQSLYDIWINILEAEGKKPQDMEKKIRTFFLDKPGKYEGLFDRFYSLERQVEKKRNSGQVESIVDSEEGLSPEQLSALRKQRDEEQLDQMKNALGKPPAPRGKE